MKRISGSLILIIAYWAVELIACYRTGYAFNLTYNRTVVFNNVTLDKNITETIVHGVLLK
jgi:hypothetical protein